MSGAAMSGAAMSGAAMSGAGFLALSVKSDLPKVTLSSGLYCVQMVPFIVEMRGRLAGRTERAMTRLTLEQ
jgi:hypothetical protein